MNPLVYLVRHGESEWNVLRRTQGQTHHPRLTRLGRSQARDAADVILRDLRNQHLDAGRLVTSDLVRATETATIIGRECGIAPELDPRLREQHLGDLEGLGYDETWAAAEVHDWSDPTLPIGGGESAFQVHERMAEVLAEIDPRRVTILISHGDAIRAAVAHLMGQRPPDAPWVAVGNGAVARYDGSLRWLA